MRALKTILLAVTVALPLTANSLTASAAELAVTRHATVHRVIHHRHHHARDVARTHRGYYFHQWGWRYGPSGRTWLGSRFQLAGWSETPPWPIRYSVTPWAARHPGQSWTW